MNIEYATQGNVVIARLSGSLTSKSTPQLEQAVLSQAKLGGPVILNLADLDYISSSGIGTVVKLYKDLQDRRCGLAIVSASSRIRMLFELSGLTQLVPFMEQESEAVSELTG